MKNRLFKVLSFTLLGLDILSLIFFVVSITLSLTGVSIITTLHLVIFIVSLAINFIYIVYVVLIYIINRIKSR